MIDGDELTMMIKLDVRNFYMIDRAPALTKFFRDTNAGARFACGS